MAEDRIDSYVDLQATEKETQQFLAMLSELEKKFDKLNSIKITLGDATKTKDIAAGAKQGAAALNELELNMRAYKATVDQAARAQAKLNVTESEAAKELEKTKQASQARTRELKNQVQAEEAAAGSIIKMRANLRQLQSEYDALAASERNSVRGQFLLKQIQATDKELKNLEGSTGRFQRNVGDYANAFGEAFGSVNGQLQKIQQQIKSGNFGGQQLQALQRQEQIILNLTERLGQEFSSTREQSRAFQEAAQQLGVAFGHDSEIFKQFTLQVGEGVDTLNDIRDTIKLASSDTRQLDRLIGAATALAGGFGLVQGFAALAGKENEDLQKTFVKLQAVMTILNGLQAIQNELKNKDSLFRKLTSFLVKEETKAIQGQVIAQRAQASATNATATATNSAAKATSRWGFALKGIGIGVLLTLIPVMASAMSNLSRTTKKVDKDLEGMGETAIEIADSAIKGLDDEINNLNDSLGRTPSAIDKARKAMGLLATELGEVLKQTATQDIRGLFDEVGNLWEKGEFRIATIQKQAAEIGAKIKELEYLQRLKAAEDFLQAEFEANRQVIKNRADLDKDANNRRLNELKKNFDQRKILEGEFLRNGKTLLNANLNDELQIIQANLDVQLSQAGANTSKRKEVEDNARKERIIAERNFQDQLSQLYQEAEQRRRKLVSSTIQGIVEITGSALSQMAQALDTITGNSTLDQLLEWQRVFKEAKDGIVDQLKDLRKELAQTALSAFESFAAFAFEDEKNRIQEQIDKLEEKKQKEIEVVNATIQNEQDKAARITTIEATAAAERDRLERQQRQIDVQKAKFEKASALLSVAIDTIQKVAAIKAQAAVLLSNPITAPLAPLALSQIPYVIASGAIAASVIAAQPIPKYKDGRDGGPATWGVVGDGGVSEVIASPDLKTAYRTPATDTFTYLEKDWKVFPDVDSYYESANNMMFKPAPLLPATSDNGSQALIRAYARGTKEIVQSIKSKQETHIHGTHAGVMALLKYGNVWIDKIDKKVNF